MPVYLFSAVQKASNKMKLLLKSIFSESRERRGKGAWCIFGYIVENDSAQAPIFSRILRQLQTTLYCRVARETGKTTKSETYQSREAVNVRDDKLGNALECQRMTDR